MLMHRDKIDLHKKNGQVIEGLMASVQARGIYMHANGVLVEIGDVIVRTSSVGHQEQYEVIDPGFYEASFSIPANYQMRVRNLAMEPIHASASHVVNNHYNLTGDNPRVTHGNDHSTNHVGLPSTEMTGLLIELKEAVENAKGLSAEQLQEAMEIVDAVSEQCLSKAPKRSIVQAMLKSLPDVAAVAQASVALLALLA